MSAKGVGKPNIALILADNLGWGELGCYGGGTLRGAPTPRSDRLAEEGLRLTNFNVESDCVPTRAALMMGRHAIRTGALQSLPQGVAQGLTRWEVLLPDLLKQQGYKTALFGKWHLGDTPERLPNARGFDEWYGLPRTLNEAYFATTVGYDPGVGPRPYLMEGKAGEDTVNLGELNLETRRLIDAEVVDRSIRFMEASVAEGSPFFLYAPTTQMHFPNLAHPDFTGVTGFGEMADSLAELDFRVGQILDAIDALGVRQDTVIIFASDNGPEFRDPWRGTAGVLARHLPHGDGRRSESAGDSALAGSNQTGSRERRNRPCRGSLHHAGYRRRCLRPRRPPDRRIGPECILVRRGEVRARRAGWSSSSRKTCARPNGATGSATTSGSRR